MLRVPWISVSSSYCNYSHGSTYSQFTLFEMSVNVWVIGGYVICMLITVCLSVLFLHANCCMFLSFCMRYLLSPHTHTHTQTYGDIQWMVEIQTNCTQIQVIRGGEKGQEDLVGGEWRGGEEEGGRKETFLWGVEAQETHCSWRHEGVQVKINRSPMVNSLMMADDPSFYYTTRSGSKR